MKLTRLNAILISVLLLTITAANAADPDLIPRPVSVKPSKGNFELSDKTVIYFSTPSTKTDAEIFNEYLQQYYGFKLKIRPAAATTQTVGIILNGDAVVATPGSYKLKISPDYIDISGDEYGVFYALQTLKQLLPTSKQSNCPIPCYEIEDYPRYSWRGMHLDVCRHFFPKEFIKRYIDFLASYKMNTFHWHLTDDQGWRIEIKKYPELTTVGGFRKGTLIGAYKSSDHQFDTVRYGGYYTQEDIIEIVSYAAARHITIVPEIEMPGHSRAALAAYPQLSCTGGPFEVGKLWGVENDVFCPKDETFTFLEDVLTEVMALFPGKYIHIGGDEVPKVRWKECAHCQALMRKEGLKDENELQSYFIHRIEKFVNSKGRTIIGWDEILEGGLAPNAAVMSWRGVEGGIAAAKQSHNVVMTPGGYCYFDHYQGSPANEPLSIGGYTTVEKVYSFEPTPKELTTEQQKYIMGAQANLWTEYIATTDHVEYMIFPRICALSEVVWTPEMNRNWDNFKARLIRHFSYLDFVGINYSKALFALKMKMQKDEEGRGVKVNLSSDFPNTGIYYTLDGSVPGISSKKIEGPVLISETSKIKAGLFLNNLLQGNIFEQQFYVNKATGKKITLTTPPDGKYNNGGTLTLVDGIIGVLPWYGKEWLGFLGTNLVAVIDLGKTETISKVTVDVLNDENSWIHLPKSIKVMVSSDGKTFTEMKSMNRDEILKQGRAIELSFDKTTARYVKVIAENRGKIPQGYNGAGEDAWLFVDEISVE